MQSTRYPTSNRSSPGSGITRTLGVSSVTRRTLKTPGWIARAERPSTGRLEARSVRAENPGTRCTSTGTSPQMPSSISRNHESGTGTKSLGYGAPDPDGGKMIVTNMGTTDKCRHCLLYLRHTEPARIPAVTPFLRWSSHSLPWSVSAPWGRPPWACTAPQSAAYPSAKGLGLQTALQPLPLSSPGRFWYVREASQRHWEALCTSTLVRRYTATQNILSTLISLEKTRTHIIPTMNETVFSVSANKTDG